VNLYSIPTLLTACLSLLLGLFILSKNSQSPLNRTFAVWCFLTTYWQGIWTVLFNIHNLQVADRLARLGYSGIIFIPIVFFHFVVTFTNNERKRKVSYFFYILGGIFTISVWTTDTFVSGVYTYYWGFYPRVGLLHVFFVGTLCVMVLTGLYLLNDYRQKVAGQPMRVNQTTYIFVSTVIYSLAAVDFLTNYGIELYPMGFIFTNIHAGIIAYAIIQYRLLDISVFIKKSLTYALLLLLLLIPCYIVMIWGQKLVFGNINYYFSVFALLLFIIVGFVFPKLRFETEEALERVLFRKRYDYRETLSRSSRDMVSMVDLDALSNNLVQTIARALRIEKGSLFLIDEVKGLFTLAATIGLDLDEFKEMVLSRDDLLVQRLTSRPQPIVREEFEIARNGTEGTAVAQRMRQLEAEISLPITSKDRLIGILNLGHKDGHEMYSDEDLELLSTLANQAAIAIENARLYENLKQSQSIIRRADRLSSLGQLTAGLAHEIRNPLVAIRTFTQLLPERYQDVEFRDSFQALALKEVDRICGLVNDLLSFARPSSPNVSTENVNEIVDGIVRILETEAKEKGVQIYRRLATNLPKVLIDKEQIKQVSMNIILNALQSIQGKGVVEVSTRLFRKDSSDEFVQIGIRDSGVGIPEKDLENIFNPFFTTKKEGVGLGLSISHQIVQEHGGYILVESQVGRGTTFFINLPLNRPTAQEARIHSQFNEENPGR
jgi:two-component system, NtrC family, sensor kinase